MSSYSVGVDVGTGSARAGVFDLSGTLIASAKRNITMFNDRKDYYEQSSENIWNAVCESVREAVELAGVSPSSISGIGFDATCSLVVVDAQGKGLPVDSHGFSERNIIVWMDHRAISQTDFINKSGHDVLSFVGNKISPEMETPKLLWLKENLPNTYKNAEYFFDLTDYLTWRATGSDVRSSCTTACKWTYLAHEDRWDETYFEHIGLNDLAKESFKKIGQVVVPPGTAIGHGLTDKSAEELGLVKGTAVPAGLIDAHAGGLGSVGASLNGKASNPESSMAYVFGTSACTMTTTSKRSYVDGVWGPYFNAMIPGKWLLEAGQSAAGAAIDHLVKLSPAYGEALELATVQDISVTQWLSENVKSRFGNNYSEAAKLSDGIHVVPEFLGNRAPFADPDSKALICGLSMDTSIESMVSLYVAGILGLGYGLKQILLEQQKSGVYIERIVISGGAGKDPLVRQLIADSAGYPVVTPACDEPVLLGSAIIASFASGAYESVEGAMNSMSSFDLTYEPALGEFCEFHIRGFNAFCSLQEAARVVR